MAEMSSDNQLRAQKVVGFPHTEGMRLVHAQIAESASLESAALFRKCWLWMLQNSDYFSSMRGRFAVNWRIGAFVNLACIFKGIRPDFEVKVESFGQDCPHFNGGVGCILLTFHSGIEMALNKHWEGLGYAPAIINMPTAKQNGPVGDQNVARQKLLFPLSRSLDIIMRGPMCLIEAREKAKRGKAVVVAADYSLFDPETKSHEVLISRRLIEFAAKVDVPVFWVVPGVDDQGDVNLEVLAFERTALISDALLVQLRECRLAANFDFGRYRFGDWLLDTGGLPNAVRRS